jgi:hypothetical protein
MGATKTAILQVDLDRMHLRRTPLDLRDDGVDFVCGSSRNDLLWYNYSSAQLCDQVKQFKLLLCRIPCQPAACIAQLDEDDVSFGTQDDHQSKYSSQISDLQLINALHGS